jgi:peptide/nickel transport system substrate-binding protein
VDDRSNRHRPMSAFEHSAYAYAREWATRNASRRTMLKAFGAAGAAALLRVNGGNGALAAPRNPLSRSAARFQDGSVLRVARGQVTDSLDAQKTSALVAHEIMWQIYDSLIYLDELGTVHPGLATEWTIADDGLSVTYTLREGVNFHDGTPFNAAAVQATVERHLDPATASPTAFMLGPLENVEATGDYEAVYTYSEPFVPMFVGLGYSYCAPMSMAAVEKFGADLGRNPVGTGPYKFVEWTADDTIVLEKNPEHTWATSYYPVDQPPQIDRVEFLVIPEDATRLAALETGEVDLVAGTDAVPIDKIRILSETPGLQVVTRPALGCYYAYINTAHEPLNDERVRQALNYAVDKEAIVGLVLDGNGAPSFNALGSGFGDYDPNLEQYAYDPEKAKALLAEAGVDSLDLTFLVIASPIYQRAAEVIQQNLAEVNINVSLEAMPVADVFARGPSGDWDLCFFYYTYSDPDILYLILSTRGGSLAWSFTEDEELNDWLDAQRVEFDKEARHELLLKVQQRVNEAAYLLFLWEGVYVAASREGLNGLGLDGVGFIHLQELSLEG